MNRDFRLVGSSCPVVARRAKSEAESNLSGRSRRRSLKPNSLQPACPGFRGCVRMNVKRAVVLTTLFTVRCFS